jgi:hypothetical protein
MSEMYPTGDHDVATDHDNSYDNDNNNYDNNYEHDVFAHHAQANEHEFDQRYHALAEYEAERHDVDYDHGTHVEYDDGHGGHYEKTEYTSYHDHEAEVESRHEQDYAEHERDFSYADDTFFEHAQQYLEGQYGHELPYGHDMPELPEGYQPHYDGSEQHTEQPADKGAPVVRN